MMINLQQKQTNKVFGLCLLNKGVIIYNCDWQDAITNKWYPQPAVLVSSIMILQSIKCRWLRLSQPSLNGANS